MSRSDPATLETWPFWAPSQEASVQAALDLAGVGPGTRLVDLGCGDGQVLLAAAERGAAVAGIEADPALAREAAGHLAEAGVDAVVTTGDLLDPALELDADVYFTYLAPATLQRLLPVLSTKVGARLVTVDFAVPHLVPDRRVDPARLYRLPGRRRGVGAPGWSAAGTLVATVPDCQSLTCLELVHAGGPVESRLAGTLAEVVSVVTGADHVEGPAHLAVDLRWEPMPSGTLVGGTIRVSGTEDHAVFVIVTDTDEEGVWDLDDDGVDGLRRALRRRQRPATLTEVLAAASS